MQLSETALCECGFSMQKSGGKDADRKESGSRVESGSI